jgi:hypothetical protein
MGNRFWIGALVVVAAFVFWGVGFFVGPNSGDADFQKMLEAMRQVKSFRGIYVESAASGQHSGRLWEMDCNRGIVHLQNSQTGGSGFEMKQDELRVGLDRYTREADGSWEKTGDTHIQYSGKWYCDNLADGTIRDLLPDVRGMLRSAMIGKADKKVVNGVRCQEWKFAMKSQFSGQQGLVCVGLDDHLPYEMTLDGGGRYSYSDYNRPIQFDAPEAVLQAAGSN